MNVKPLITGLISKRLLASKRWRALFIALGIVAILAIAIWGSQAASATWSSKLNIKSLTFGSSTVALPIPCPTFTVNDIGDAVDANQGDGVCATSGSVCTLRAAIQEANALSSCSGATTINFNISGSGVQTITPGSVYPAITRPVIIDATTQAGSSCTTVGSLTIELNGTSAGATGAQAGLQLNPTASGSTIKGLVINRFGSYGMFVNSSSNNVQCNYVGTNVAGTIGLGNHNSGIRISGSSNLVGGSVAGNGNIFSGNSSEGIRIVGTGNQVQGNYVGIDAAGTAALPNGGGGVDIQASANTTVGGTSAGARNVISGNSGSNGVLVATSSNTIVQGNYIGTDATGTSGLGNYYGVNVNGGATIGGTGPGEGNLIAFNITQGIVVFASANNSLRGNSVYSNGGPGIDLNADGVTANDNKDTDTGPNNLQNFPVLTPPLVGATTVSGTLNSAVGQTFIIDVYSNDACDPSGNGEGKTYLGSTTTSATDSNGNVSFNVTVPAVVSGKPLTATATDASGNTSEFSACVSPPPPNFVVTKTDDTNDHVCDNDCSLREAIEAANANPDANTITFAIPLSDGGCNGGLGPCTITLGGTELAITHDVSIDNTSSGERVIVSGAHYSRIFDIPPQVTATLSNLTIINGSTPAGGSGGGIQNKGTLTIVSSTVIHNVANRGGGGISNAGVLTVIASTITDNTTIDGGGGGIRNPGRATIINSTISANSAGKNGGGILNDGGTTAITNSTITRNQSGDSGAGICAHCGDSSNDDVVLQNTIVAGNFNGTTDADITGDVDSNSFNNLIGNGSELNASISNGTRGNQIGSSGSPIDPKLGPLQDNGGPTRTHALLIGSPAIDAGDNCVTNNSCNPSSNTSLSTDQRGSGFARKLDGDGDTTATVDIGAFEMHGGAGTNGADLVVNTTADHDDGVCEALSAGHDCTLREAINAANASPDGNQIKFDIPTNDAGYLSEGTGVWTIRPQLTLPAIIYPVTIDGYTQRPCSSNSAPCSQVNTDPACNDALLLIELSGRDNFHNPNIGLDIVGGSSTVRGLVINQFLSEGFGAGIRLSGNGGNTIVGNFIGTDASGTRAEDDGSELTANNVGVQIENCAGNTIGGPIPINDPAPSNAAAARNVISANYDDGIQITGRNSSGNIIRGNFIGTDSSGTAIIDDTEDENSLGNNVGIEIYDGPNNVVGNSEFAGAAVAGAGNVISGNYDMGVEISSGLSSGPTGNGVGSNFIGTDLTGTLDLGNGGDGVQLCQDAHGNLVGGSTAGFRNAITHNLGNGVNLLAPTLSGNTIRLNSIHDNALLGIDLANDGVTANDSGDDDTGPNDLQNFPLIQSASVTGNTITIAGTLSSTPGQTFTVDFYGNTVCNDDQPNNAGHGEGRAYIGSLTNVTTDSLSGDALLSFSGPMPPNTGSIITATATNSRGSTSEFSQCFPATVFNVALTVAKSSPSPALLVGHDSTYTITVTNNGAVPASTATVKEAIPAGLNLTSATGTNWICAPAGPNSDPVGTVTCTFSGGTISGQGGSSTIGVVVRPKGGTAGNSVFNKYSVDPSGGTGAPDPNTCARADDPTLGCGAPVDATISASCSSTLTVNDTGDAPDAVQGDGVCETVAGNRVCTLRAAIEEANALSSCSTPITINFNITGAGVHRISPGSPLPNITTPVIIDGYSQPGSSVNNQAASDNAILNIELTGASAGAATDGLVLGADGCTIDGLVINRFGGAGIKILNSGNAISGNFVGTDVTGMLLKDGGNLPYGNKVGLLVFNGSSNLVGCTTADERNIISGNTDDGVQITGMTAAFNFVQDNLIGTKANGTEALGNGGAGVEVYEGGIFNVIGFQPAVEVGQRNRRDQSSQAKRLSPINPQPTLSGANVIAFNHDEGVLITSASDISNKISQNSIYSNGKLGINLAGGAGEDSNGVTPNDLKDPDTGPNQLQNFPLITAVDAEAQTIAGTLNSTPNTTNYVVEFFANDSCDSPSGHGEGQTYLGSVPADTDADGNASFTFSAPIVPFAAGQVITATVTDSNGNTSEFSPCSVILSVNKSQPSPSPVAGQNTTYTITVTNSGTAPANTATVKEAIPAGLDLTSATGTNWNCTPSGPSSDPVGTVICTFSGSLGASGTSTIAIVVKPNLSVVGQSVTNKYSVDPAGGTNPPDPTTCTAADTPAAGCGTPVITSIASPPCPTITVNPASLPNGAQDASYSQVVTASGGTGPYTFSITNGALPNGLSLSSGGTLDGTPSTAGPFTFTITAKDTSNNCVGSRAYSISICPSMFTVDANSDLGDANPGDGLCATSGGVCTLRAAIEEANATPNACGAINIDFNIGSTAITLTGGQLTIDHDININGPATNSVMVTANNASRVFTVNTGKVVSISSLTISGGSVSGGDGGGIQNNGTLTIQGVTLSGNTAANGGAIRSDGAITLVNTTISGNNATGNGGGLYNAINQAILTNVTVAYNRSDSDNNGSGAGGGIFRISGNVLLHNTIVADNFKGASPSTAADDIGGTVDSSSSYNVIGTGSGGLSSGGATHNQVGVPSALLGKLINNGGPTFTHGLLYNSPAVDTGDNSVINSPLFLNADQRGVSRPQPNGGTIDIGAYERQATETRRVPNGQNVNVDLNDVRVGFPCVPSGNCETGASSSESAQPEKNILTPQAGLPTVSITVVDPSAQPSPSPGFVDGNSVSPPLPAFDVSTASVTYDQPVTICFYLPSINDQTFFNGLRLFHREAGPNNIYGDNDDVLVNVTRTTNPIDFPNRLLCGEVRSFSAFVIGHTATTTAANGSVSGQIADNNGNPVEGVAVRMSGTQDRLTITDAQGYYHFDNVETNGFYTLVPSRANFSFGPSQRSFSALGQHTEATFNAIPTGNGLNPLDTTEYFVRQQYLDFLGREPDESGFNFWVDNIEHCGGDANCRAVKRIDTSAAFFLSIEFQQTGYLVYRTYRAAYGDLPNAPVPLKRNEFTADSQELGNGVVVLQIGWEQKLDSNKQAYAAEFVQRPRFTAAYPSTLTPTEFVTRLFTNAGVTPSDIDRSAAVNEFGSAATSSDVAARGRVLRRISENSAMARQEFNQAFVLMQYFGYLRRDADTGPDLDFSGYTFWLNKLNTFGNFRDAEMVKAFLVSLEYRGRFPR